MISFARYQALLVLPGVRATILASLPGRLPIGITGLAILLLAQASTGSFARAGAATACYVAGLGGLAPVLGRLLDTKGPRRVLVACGILYPLSLSALVASVTLGTPTGVTLALAALAGATFPPITACMRAFLKRSVGEASLLAVAYSLESVMIESIFILGPMLVALFVAAATPAVAVLFAAACAAGGSFLFLRSPAVATWVIEPRPGASLLGPLTAPGFLVLLAIVLCYAVAFGLVEIGVTAFASEARRPAAAGVLLALMSVGSVAGGLAYGSRGWHLPLVRQFAAALALMGAGILPLALLTGMWTFAGVSVVAGLSMAPALAMQSMLVAKTAPGHTVAEAFTWSATALLAGVSLGFALGGALLAVSASATVLALAAAVSLTAAGAAYLCLRS